MIDQMNKLGCGLSMGFTLGMIVVGLSTTACFTSLTDGQTIDEFSEPLRVAGYATQPESRVTVHAFNWESRSWDILDETISESSHQFDPRLFPWTTGDVVLDIQYWELEGCEDGKEKWHSKIKSQQHFPDGRRYDMATFDQEGKECILEKLQEGMMPFDAGLHCNTGVEINLYMMTFDCLY